MCGIAGFSFTTTERVSPRVLSTTLLNAIEERGRDATGAAWVQHAGGVPVVRVSKRAVRARRYIEAGHLAAMPATTITAILHTRYATQGSPENPLNNHPISHGPIVGVHNGHLDNDDALFAALGVERRGEVDSEAAFALLGTTRFRPEQVLDRLDGRAALAWVDRRRGRSSDLNLARVSGSPLAIGQTVDGSFVFASTIDLLDDATLAAGVEMDWLDVVPEWSYLRVRRGVICDSMGIVGKAVA